MKKIKNSVLLIFIILIAIVLALVIAAFFMFYNNFENSGRMASGIFVKGVNISRNDKRRSQSCCYKIFRRPYIRSCYICF
ncbi:MAG: hypothetical protein IJ629_01765 [Clostridia bacterium]|nr:hypothetical protein [Clostridia bacterium]